MRPGKLESHQIARYSRHILLPEVGMEGQEKLAAARVLVIGAGGLGSPVALYLAAAGVGTLGIADFDRVEAHNLQRQIIHDTASIGDPKTQSARDKLLALNPEIGIHLHEEGVTPENSVALFQQYDLIVDGSDNFGTRYLNNDAAFFAKKPLVYGSIFRFEGQVSLFDTAEGGPCYRCLFPRPPAPGTVPNCAEAGVFGALCGMVGSMQAMEAIKFILGVGESMRGKLLVIDALSSGFRTIRLKKDPACPLCGNSPEIDSIRPATYDHTCAPASGADTETIMNDETTPLEVDVAEAKHLLENHPDTVLLDVREPYEVEICHIEGSVAMPMQTVPENLESLPRDKKILVHCHHGARSLQVTEFLRKQGFSDVSNVAGGIDDWAQKLDPSMQRY